MYCYVIPIIQYGHTSKEFQVLLFNTNNCIQHYSFVCTQLNDSKYYYVSLTIQLNMRHLFSYIFHKALAQYGWGCRIHRLHLCGGVRFPPAMSVLDMTLNILMGEAPVMLELWGMRSTPTLPLLPGRLWPRMVAPDRALSMG